MKKIFIAIVYFATTINTVYSQIGKPFPELKGITLEDKNMILPTDTKGKFTLLGLAYSKAAESDLQSWYQPIYTTFIEKNKPSLFNDTYDVHLYFIPMFTGINQSASETARKKMKEGFDKELAKHVLVYKGELKVYKEQLDFEKKDTPYFFVLDKSGNIIHAISGKYSEEKLSKIEELISEQ
ncbi:MAG: hypothetical protein EAZ07_09940 [Cytophagales bacterium]|nr:MAG: hypothetical protein EAZ07_09940 [Cytophagales bacterium]